MNDVITFFFQCLNTVWSTIYSNWVLSISFMIMILSYIVSLINQTKGDK